MTNQEMPAENSVDRRRLLRRAGTVAAGVAGAGVVSAMAASPANAASGDPVTLGAANSASDTTAVDSTGSAATLSLVNSSAVDPNTGESGAALNLTPAGDVVRADAEGNIGMSTDGTVWVTSQYAAGQVYADYVYTTANANITVPITPIRAINTGYPETRTRILNEAGNIDSSGRLIAGKTITVDLSDLVFFGWAAFGNLTVVNPTNAGFVTLYPYGAAQPNASSINFQTNTTLSNSFICGLGYDPNNFQTHNSLINIYAQRTTKLLLDITAFVVSYGSDILPGAAPLSGTATVTRTPTREQLRRRTAPTWQK